MIELQSTHSMRVSLEALRRGEAGLDEHRKVLLQNVPEIGDWAEFPYGHLTMKDIMYLTAKTRHEFAILRGKHVDILFHGTVRQCSFCNELEERLMSGKLEIYGHSHPNDEIPSPSTGDREALQMIGQKTSRLISALTGEEIIFNDNEFEIP